MMDSIRVMIVEDSSTVREYLRQAVQADTRLTVAAVCESAEEAISKLDRVQPDVISMDIQLPGMSGLEATRRIMETHPTPIVIVSRSVNASELDATMDALRAGAVSAVEAPRQEPTGTLSNSAARVCRELAAMSQIKVVRQRFNPVRSRPGTPPLSATQQRSSSSGSSLRRASMVGIVASTGGPHAVETVLAALGSSFPLPVLLVQHITVSFHPGFIAWLDRNSPLPVECGRDGQIPEPGRVYVAPAERHLLLRGQRLATDDGPPVSGQRPSGTVLLQSMAESLGAQAVGIVLTGMGIDGAEGLFAIRRAGGYTIAEDDATAVVNGMPQSARDLDAACVSLPLDTIGTAIKHLTPICREACA